MIKKLLSRFWEWCLRVKALTWLRIASVTTLVALALMVWSLFDPTLIPIMVGMSLAQLFGTIAFATYLLVVFLDITRQRRARRASLQSMQLPKLPEEAPKS